MSFYKTKDTAVLETVNKFFDERNQLQKDALAFGDLFSAEKAIFHNSPSDYSFGGLIFDPPKDDRFWTKRDRRDRTQRPRDKVSKMTAEEKTAHEKLLEQWKTKYPKVGPSKDEFYVSIGTNWGELLFGSGLVFFIHDQTVYIETTKTLWPKLTEILGSEYQAAKAALQAEDNHVPSTAK